MRKYRLLFSGCLLLLGITCVAVSLQNFEIPAIEKPDLSKSTPLPVIKTINGNTIVILQDGNEATISLAGVDRPPATQLANSADRANRFVGNLLKGESVYAITDPRQKQTDPNSGIAAYIYRAPDGLFVNAEIIRQGYGSASTKSLFRYMNEFRRLELFAKQAGKGIWASNGTILPEKQTSAKSVEPNEPNKPVAKPLSVVTPASDNQKESGNDDVIVYVTKSGAKYHSQGCRFLSKSSIPMKLKEAKIEHSPCGVCKPPQ